jgi:hypothetical protein
LELLDELDVLEELLLLLLLLDELELDELLGVDEELLDQLTI